MKVQKNENQNIFKYTLYSELYIVYVGCTVQSRKDGNSTVAVCILDLYVCVLFGVADDVCGI